VNVVDIMRLATALLVANRPRLIVLTAGSVAVALAASAMSLASITGTVTLRESVGAGWRGAYDILVRPRDAATLRLDDLRIVPANYLGARTAGISREEWQSILAIPGIEVAAPVSALGWMKQDDVSVGVQVDTPSADDILRFDIRTEIDGEVAESATSFISVDPDDPNNLLLFFGGEQAAMGPDGLEVALGALPSGWGLVVGVDPVQEAGLIGLPQYVNGDYLRPGLSTVNDQAYGGVATGIPVLTAETTRVGGNVRVEIHRISGRNNRPHREGRDCRQLDRDPICP
jgi:hypothetical protein